MGMNIRLLRADEIDCRAQSVSKAKSGSVGAVLLLYKNARVDMALLDEIFGVFGWQRTHELINDNLFCTIRIRNPETGEWVSKQDVGVESNTEKEKGQASDAFKRAGFNIGIGRELYTAPFVWVDLADGEWYQEQQGNKTIYRVYSSVKFFVSDISYSDDRAITSLVIVDKNNNVRYSTGGGVKSPSPAQKPAAGSSDRGQAKTTATGQNSGHGGSVCPGCGGSIGAAEKAYSMKKYGRELCRDCQKNA